MIEHLHELILRACVWKGESEYLHTLILTCMCVEREERVLALINTMSVCGKGRFIICSN